MATTILCDPVTRFYLLLVASLFVAALWTRRDGRSPTRLDVRDIGRLPAHLYRIGDNFPRGLTGHHPGRTPIKGPYASVLEEYARQFEEAVERIRLSAKGSRRR